MLIVTSQEDYENMYQGMWDLIPDENNELALKRGEICHVISKEYDNYGWWVAEKDKIIGLVPRDYLMEAYEL
ncbi:src kinase-associated phosphoprotein 2-like [Ciona intestinalis]